MIIIFEGLPDSGKTTLIEQFLKENRKFKPWKYKGQLTSGLDKSDKTFSERVRTIQTTSVLLSNIFHFNIVLDRFHLSEAIYSEIFRGLTSSLSYFALIEHTIEDKVLIVYCEANLSTILQRQKDRNKKDFGSQQLLNMKTIYDYLLSKTKFPVIKVKLNNPTDTRVALKAIRSKLEKI